MFKIKLLPILGLLLLVASAARAQEVQLNEEKTIVPLFQVWIRNNREHPRVSGWRVQIMSTTDRKQVEEGRNRFRMDYPEVPAEWLHEKPYYKLRVGAFRTRLEALALIALLRDTYPGAYPAKDPNIHPRDFLE